ncbi:PapB/FocB family fimbrial expression transcriptional regulator [Citrobacter meridianamericanus]
MSRKEVCAQYGVNAGNLSVKLSRLQVISQTIARMYPCQYDRMDCPVSKHSLASDLDRLP